LMIYINMFDKAVQKDTATFFFKDKWA